MARELALILNNGSINSAVVTAIAAQQSRPIVVYVDPSGDGEAINASAQSAYEAQAAHFKPYREHTLAMPFLHDRATSLPTPVASPADPRQSPSVSPLLVNLLPIMAAGARLAAHYGAKSMYLGLRVGPRADELAQAVEYIQVWNELLQMPCGQANLSIETPLLELEPWQVIDLGFQVTAPLEKTWSCDEDESEPCGTCRGCTAREAAFKQAAKPDPQKASQRR